MLKLDSAVIVEGKYDKIRLERVVDATIIVTDGFGIFKNRELKSLIRRLAEKNGIIIFTDSDSAGMLIRNHIKSFVPPEYIKNVYAPQVPGKEKRKTESGKEGLLGVEGIDEKTLLNCFLNAGVTCSEIEKAERVTKQDLYELGFSGCTDSAAKRRRLLKELNLPQNMSGTAMLAALNALYDRDEALSLLSARN